MHKFLKSVGFSMCRREKDVRAILRTLAKDPASVRYYQLDHDTTICEIKCEAAPGIGVAIYGEMDDRDDMEIDYYYPYLESSEVSSTEYCTLQRHIDRDTYAGMLEEYRVGLSLIFYLLNPLEYRQKKQKLNSRLKVESVCLSGLASEGIIILPVQKSEKEKEKAKVAAANRNSLIRAAEGGDESAMETLSFDDYELYNSISRRIENEDIYSIVDTSFMPSGLESDQYAMLGEITSVEKRENRFTHEYIYDLRV
ncbi:MAG TPA: DUF3881 domain-containing protein, partial [Lachnospiraceae bacterium]|nr:DUF3881 domain-containing protein [Lachnospiraceae bacterium]